MNVHMFIRTHPLPLQHAFPMLCIIHSKIIFKNIKATINTYQGVFLA